MSDSTDPHCSTSKSNLIKVHHVGVTAQMQSPLKRLLPHMSSSSDSDAYQNAQTQYSMFKNDRRGDASESTMAGSSPRTLYEMHAEPDKSILSQSQMKPQRIEFQRYSKKRPHLIAPSRPVKTKDRSKSHKASQVQKHQGGFMARLVQSLDNMCKCSPQNTKNIIDDLPEPQWNRKEATKHTCIGIYPFEHGCADYLSTTDTHPKINSIILADRATTYATHFWAELFGLLHIAVAFVVAFVLQSYRFVLYCLVNSLIVGLLHMTSDYLVKPFLTVIFNGFLQPPLIFVYNILCSVRDILEPVAQTLDNFMQPLATVGRSFRLVDVNYRKIQRLGKDV